jgi:hypothetical protein
VYLGGVIGTQPAAPNAGLGGSLLGGVIGTQPAAPNAGLGGSLLGGIVGASAATGLVGAGGVVLGGIVATSGGAGGILTPCDPGTPIPATLYWRLSGASDPANNQHGAVTYDVLLTYWNFVSGTIGICVWDFQLICGGGSWTWYYAGGPNIGQQVPASHTAVPLYWSFDCTTSTGGLSLVACVETSGCVAAGTAATLFEIRDTPWP